MIRLDSTCSNKGQLSLGALENAPIGAMLIDHQGTVLAHNKYLLRTKKFSHTDCVGKRLTDLLGNGCSGLSLGASNTHLGPTLIHAQTLIGSILTSEFFEMNVAEAGKEYPANSFLVFFKDVTEDIALQKSLRRCQREAEAAHRAKSHFLANMSHEIRTPLSAVIGYADLVASGDGNPEERWGWSHRIRENAEHLKRLIDNILDVSCIETNSLEVHQNEEVDLGRLLPNVQQSFSLIAQRKGLGLRIETASELPRYFYTDGSRLRQILINLIGNAIKFTERGEVVLRLSYLKASGKPKSLAFDVIDSGLGMTKSEAIELFHPFTQVDMKYTRRFGGMGIGLALSKRLACALGGDLTVLNSKKGKGSVFRLVLPEIQNLCPNGPFLSIPEQVMIQAPAKVPNLQGKKILLIEDSEDNQILVRRILSKAGAVVDIAENGKLGVDRALESEYSLILMDIQMPIMDGYEAQRQLKRAKYPKPVIAFTAHNLDAEVKKIKSAGFQGHLTKPINKDKLYQMIADLSF